MQNRPDVAEDRRFLAQESADRAAEEFVYSLCDQLERKRVTGVACDQGARFGRLAGEPTCSEDGLPRYGIEPVQTQCTHPRQVSFPERQPLRPFAAGQQQTTAVLAMRQSVEQLRIALIARAHLAEAIGMQDALQVVENEQTALVAKIVQQQRQLLL